MKPTDFLPDGFHLRSGAGGGDPRNGLCYMETVAFIAGENVTDRPECACPVITAYGIGLNDRLDDKDRQRLLPLIFGTAGTRSKEHEAARIRILSLAAIDMAKVVLPLFEAKRPSDNRARAAIEAAISYWEKPSKDTAYAAADAGYAASGAAYAAYDASAAAASAAASAAAASGAAYAAYAAYAASAASYDAAYAAADADAYDAAYANHSLKARIVDRAILALREAIEAGPNGGIDYGTAVARVIENRGLLLAGCNR